MANTLRNTTIIWVALVSGVALYAVVAFALIATGAVAPWGLHPSIVRAVAAGVLVYMAAGLVLRRLMVAAIPAEATPDDRAERYLRATLIGLSLMESGGLAVITLGLLSSSTTWVLAGGASAVAMMLFGRPTAAEAEVLRG